jgi:hypothetical protein
MTGTPTMQRKKCTTCSGRERPLKFRKNAFGVYFVFKSLEQRPFFRVTVPKFPTKDPNHRILARQKSPRDAWLQRMGSRHP